MKNFFSLFHFKELRILLSLELVVILLICGISMNQGIELHICYEALVASLICWIISSIVDPKDYFNFFTLLGTGIFGYGVFWFGFEILWPLLIK